MFERFRQKKPVSARDESGKFVAAAPAAAPSSSVPIPIKQAENEVKVVAMGADLLTSVNNLVKSQRELVESEVEARLAMNAPPSEDNALDYILPILEVIAPYAGKYIPGILEKMGIQAVSDNSGNAPSVSPPAAQQPGPNALELITQAAKTSPKSLKLAMPVINSELEKAGIDKNVFKQAILNLSKAV